MKKSILLSLIICALVLAIGCTHSDIDKTDNMETEIKEKEIDNQEEIIADYGYAVVYDATKYNIGIDGFIPQYQYFVFNEDKTDVIDAGMMNYTAPKFSKISEKIIKAEYGTGATDEWICVYYNLETQSKSEEYKYALLEINEKVAFLYYEKGKTYLRIKDIFKDNEEKVLIGNDLFNPGLIKARKNDNVIKINFTDKNGKEYTKNISLGK